jgi:blue copper oxidase
LLTKPPHQFDPDVEIQLTATHKQVPIFNDRLTDVWSYQGELLRGDTFHLIKNPNTYLGPTIRVKTGQKAEFYLYHCHNLEHEDLGMMRNFI